MEKDMGQGAVLVASRMDPKANELDKIAIEGHGVCMKHKTKAVLDKAVRGILCPRCRVPIDRCATFRRGRGMVPSSFFYCPSCQVICDIDGVVQDPD